MEDDLLSDFLAETGESLAILDSEIVKFEQNPNDPELLGNIFRIMHTIKGTCGFLGLPRLESVAHASENVLGLFRDGKMNVTSEAVSVILASLDCIKNILEVIENTGSEPEADNADLIAKLDALCAGGGGDAAPKETVEAKIEDQTEAFAESQDAAEIADESIIEEDGFDEETPGLAAIDEAVRAQKENSEQANAPLAPEYEAEHKKLAVQQTLRVNVELLENLMTVVSELVLTRNQLMQIMRDENDSRFVAPLQRLNHVTSELQEGVMKTRMQPIGNAWSKLPRIIRDLAVDLNKKIDLKMLGADTELDRQVLELIKDPLTHMVRNSADHGLETPDERVKAGKNETGQVILNAFHEGGHIIIEIKDDGKGLNTERIKQKILENNLATESEIASLSDQQIHQFVFKAGFSTAQKVTNVSGRGVGMDVVRTNIEKIGGTVELKSIEGKGSTFTIKIPLTLAIVSALIIESGGEKFAIPQISVLELVRASKNSEHKVEKINNVPVLRLRNRLLPLVALDNLLELDSRENGNSLSHLEDDAFIVVSKVGSNSFGIIVDRVFDTEEIVVKPVSPILRHIELFSGNTILGDGSVIMILDPNGIAGKIGEVSIEDTSQANAADADEISEGNKIAILLFRSIDNTPRAVPLALVSRLEDIDKNSIESSNGKLVVQYRGKLMPLIYMGKDFDINSRDRVPVLVFTENDKTMGIIVDEILDIVEDRLDIELSDKSPGIVGSSIVQEKATDVIDVTYYLKLAFPDWFKGSDKQSPGDYTKRILLVDDSKFFQNLIGPILKIAGYNVVVAEDPSKALSLSGEGQKFDAIISDIEMPGMNGFEFAEKVKKETIWGEVPLIALSSRSTQSDLDKGREVGFIDYVSKNDQDALLRSLSHTFSNVRGAA